MIAGGLVIFFTQGGSFSAVVNGYQTLFTGAFGTGQNISYTLVNVTQLALCGLSVAIAFRAGLFNIGAEGQLAVGAMTAAIIGLKFSTWPGWLLTPLMIIASMVAGGIWGGIVGFLKAWRGAHEVVTTIMLNWIAFFVTDYLISGPFQAPGLPNQTSSMPPQTHLPQLATLYNQTLGTFLPQISLPEQYTLDIGFLIALLVLVIYWFIMSRTTFGYEVRVVGQNPRAAQYAGISVKRNMFLVMAIAGAFAGLAGALFVMGQPPYQLQGQVFRDDTTGFDAIGVALLGQMSPIGVFLGGLLFGALREGAAPMELATAIPKDLITIIQAFLLFFITAEIIPVIRRSISRRLAGSARPELVEAIAGTPIATATANGQAGSEDTGGGEPLEETVVSLQESEDGQGRRKTGVDSDPGEGGREG